MMGKGVKQRPASATADLRQRIRSEGAEAAFKALVSVCNDPSASAQAKATAGSTLFRSAGLMEKHEDDLDDKPVEEMSYDELLRYGVKNAHLLGAPVEMVDLVDQGADVDPVGPEQNPEAAPTRRPRRAAGMPAAAEAGLLGDFG